MIYFLKGVVAQIEADFLVVDVQGVGYMATCSARTLARFAVGEVVKLYTFTNVKEQELSLFGFASHAERTIFETLIDVSGVGPRVGLAILTVLSPDEVVAAIASQNHTAFARASGVGPKLAQRIVLELKNKVGHLPTATGGGGGAAPVAGVAGDVVSALVNLGYKPPQAQQAVAHVHQTSPQAGFDVLFKASLAELRRT